MSTVRHLLQTVLGAAACALASAHCTCQPAATTCDSDDDCPTGYLCRSALCTSSGGDGSAQDGAVLDTGPTDAPPGDRRASDQAVADRTARDLSVPSDTGGRDGSDGGQSDRLAIDATADREAGVRDGAPGDAAADAGTVVSGPCLDAGYLAEPIATCGTVAVFGDDFLDPDLVGWDGYSSTGISRQSGNGAISFSAPAGSAGGNAYYRTRDMAAFADGALVVDVATAAIADPGIEAYLRFGGDAVNLLQVGARGGQLFIEDVRDGAPRMQTFETFDPAAHRWWRLRDVGGRTLFETAPDGSAWCLRFATATPAHARSGQVQLGLRRFGTTAQTSTITFNGLNQGSPTLPWCPASSLVNGFDAWQSNQGQLWRQTSSGSCDLSPGPTAVTLSNPGPRANDWCRLTTTQRYLLDERGVAIEIPARTIDVSVFAGLRITTRDGSVLRYGVAGATGAIEASSATDIDCNMPPTTDAQLGDATWLEVKNLSGRIEFWFRTATVETWVRLAALQCVAVDFSAVNIALELAVATGAIVSSSASATFANYNQLPP